MASGGGLARVDVADDDNVDVDLLLGHGGGSDEISQTGNAENLEMRLFLKLKL
jgi:hypothetical protein